MIQGDCFSWVFPVLTKHLDTIANLHLTILALTWGLISRRVLQSQSCECLDSGCKEPDKIYTGDDSRIWSCGIGSTILLSSSEPGKDFKNYKASGMYGILRGLLIGGNYRYSHTDCGIATPDSGSLECVFGYNYTDMSDTRSHIYGGRLNDVSFTVNYYINKYMIWRFRYSYTKITDRVGFENQSLSAFQTRFQVIF